MKKNFRDWINEARYIYEEDPAAHSVLEVYLLYPGLRALRAHAKAKSHWEAGRYFRARAISERTKTRTGIEIHPGASIGDHVFIDHGDGVVIGETAIVGDRVTIFHGVTLGGTGKEKGVKRHPTVEHDAIIGAHAIVLGDITIGHHAKVGAGAVVLQDVPPYATAVGVPARIIPHDEAAGENEEFRID